MKLADIAELRIHPGVGIARLGNSPTEFYIGPEAPDDIPNHGRPYKDALGRVKRQAARFRVYAYDADGHVIDEVTCELGTVVWEVHLANKKGAWFQFHGKSGPRNILRNQWTQSGPEFQADPDKRTNLIIDPGSRTISGLRKRPVLFSGGSFSGIEVPLGEIQTDAAGRLLVLGGFGHSGMLPTGGPLSTYANNDEWFDDTSDGPVSATVTLTNGRVLTAKPARVLVVPPKFTPGHENIVNLYEVAGVASGALPERLPAKAKVDFYRDVLPILKRAFDYTWLNAEALMGHGAGMGGDFLQSDLLKILADPANKSGVRARILQRIRVPAAISANTNASQAHLHFMPQLSGDDGDAVEEKPGTWLTLLPLQYDILKHWADGDFVQGLERTFRPFDRIPVAEQPAALDEAALRPCVGGAFYPGIEMTYIATEPRLWSGPLRLSPEIPPGGITQWMAVPWQADFYECNTHWWPVARPDDVLPEAAFQSIIDEIPLVPDNADETGQSVAAALAERQPWARDLAPDSPAGDNDMVTYWSELGFVIPKTLGDTETVYVETERAPIVGANERELFYRLMNIDENLNCLPKARQYVDRTLAQWEAFSNDKTTTPQSQRFFYYTEDAFKNRLDEIYYELVDDARLSDPAADPTFRSYQDMVTRTIQMSPFNLTDGAWLRFVGNTGPIDEIRSLLNSICMDELGDGVVSQNHCNLYLDLCHSVGYYPMPLNSREYAFDSELLDSAFSVPAFELAISQFSNSYYPEILGMTLNLEWEVVGSKPTRDLLEHFGIDAHYYTMHIGIDNAVNGHGQRAAEAIQLYLQRIRANGGDAAVQHTWRRIWNGFVTFGNMGTLGVDLPNLIKRKAASLRDQMIAMITRKAPYGRYNHEKHTVGANLINDWFADPPGFLDALLANGYLIAGNWTGSKIYQLTSFQSGPMYRVFTDDELALWKDYVESLAEPAPAPPAPPAPAPMDAARAMAAVIATLEPPSPGPLAHQRKILKGADGTTINSVSGWMGQPAPVFMAALANPDNGLIQVGDPMASSFVTDLIAPSGPMGDVFARPAPPPGYGSCYDVAVSWIKAGCPMPPDAVFVRKLRLTTASVFREKHPFGVIAGMGAIH